MSELRKLLVRWTGPMGLLALFSFVGLAFLVVFLTIIYFKSLGVTDIYLLTLVPLGVIFVLTSSWAYLTKAIAFIPKRPLTSKKKRRRRSLLERVTSIESKFFTKFTVKSAIVVVVTFLLFLFVPYLIMSPQFLALSSWLYYNLPWLRPTFEAMNNVLKPLHALELTYRYVLSENLSALFAALVSANWKYLRRQLPW